MVFPWITCKTSNQECLIYIMELLLSSTYQTLPNLTLCLSSNKRFQKIQKRTNLITRHKVKENRMLQNKAADKFSIFFPWIITNLHMNQ